MPFQLKDFPSIAASMINHARATQSKLTDFNVGSVARTIFEAPAIEIEELYQQMFIGLKEGIPVATYNSFGFEKRAPEPAVGVIRFVADDPAHAGVEIGEGVRATSANGDLQFRTTTASSIPVHAQYIDVPAVCETPGQAGNVPPGTITVMQDAVAGVASVTNPAWFFGGREIESDGEQKARFAAFVAALPRGTKAAIEYGAKMAAVADQSGLVTEAVRHVFIDEPYLADPLAPVGLVDCFIHNGSGGTSPALVAETKKIIDGYRKADGTPVPGWKAAGVIVNVYAAQEVVVAVDGALSVSKYAVTATAAAQAEAAIAAYFDGLKIGAPVYASEIIAAVMNVDGVVNFQMTSPAADVVVARHQKAMLGAVRFG